MDWAQILYNCLIWIIFVVLLGAGLYLLVAVPAMLVAAVVGIFWSVLRFFIPILPSFWQAEPSKPRKSGFHWLDKTEAQKLTELNEHIRIQQMNQERNSR